MDFHQNTQPETNNDNQDNINNTTNSSNPYSNSPYDNGAGVPYQNQQPYGNANAPQAPYQIQQPYGNANTPQAPYQAQQPYGNANAPQAPYQVQQPYGNNGRYPYQNNANTPYPNGNPYANNNGNPYQGNAPYGMPVPEPGSSLANAAMVLGIISIISCFTFTIYPAFILGSIAIILALLSKGRRTKLLSKARTGIICGVIGLVSNVILIAMLFSSPDFKAQLDKTCMEQYGKTFDEMIEEILEDSDY